MAFLALGINHKTASVDVRERVAFTPEQLVEPLQHSISAELILFEVKLTAITGGEDRSFATVG